MAARSSPSSISASSSSRRSGTKLTAYFSETHRRSPMAPFTWQREKEEEEEDANDEGDEDELLMCSCSYAHAHSSARWTTTALGQDEDHSKPSRTSPQPQEQPHCSAAPRSRQHARACPQQQQQHRKRGTRMTLLLVPTLLSSLLLLPTLLLTLIALTPVPAQAQLPTGTNIGQQNNVTSLRGTWSSGSGNVVTGLQFFNPANNTFTYPTTAGMSYSFTDDFHWEQALYIYQPKADNPYCVTAQLIWQHGTYSINGSNFISLQPFKGDGMQQIASRCTKTSQSVQPYNQPELMSGFEIHLDTHYGQSAYYLKMYGFDGTPKPLMWKVYDPPQMLPTVQLKEQVLNNGS